MAAEHVVALGERIRQRREELGLTQEEVARRMPGKVAGARISLWERGEHRPHDANLEELARALETSAAALLSPAPDKSRTPQLSEVVGESQLDRIERRLNEARDEQDRISGLISQQNELLQRQSRILDGIEELLATQQAAARRLEEMTQAAIDAMPAPADQAQSKAQTGTSRGS